jgi:hypothetical protein
MHFHSSGWHRHHIITPLSSSAAAAAAAARVQGALANRTAAAIRTSSRKNTHRT